MYMPKISQKLLMIILRYLLLLFCDVCLCLVIEHYYFHSSVSKFRVIKQSSFCKEKYKIWNTESNLYFPEKFQWIHLSFKFDQFKLVATHVAPSSSTSTIMWSYLNTFKLNFL